jgi:hypothetical protein
VEFQAVSGPEPEKEDHPRWRPQETKQGAPHKVLPNLTQEPTPARLVMIFIALFALLQIVCNPHLV